MISREAATSGQLSLIHRGISDVKDVSDSLKILEVEQLAFTLDVGEVKESLVVLRHTTCKLSAWIAHGRTAARKSTCVFQCFPRPFFFLNHFSDIHCQGCVSTIVNSESSSALALKS